MADFWQPEREQAARTLEAFQFLQEEVDSLSQVLNYAERVEKDLEDRLAGVHRITCSERLTDAQKVAMVRRMTKRWGS